MRKSRKATKTLISYGLLTVLIASCGSSGVNTAAPVDDVSSFEKAIEWSACEGEDAPKAPFECGFVTVPLDYRDATGNEVDLLVGVGDKHCHFGFLCGELCVVVGFHRRRSGGWQRILIPLFQFRILPHRLRAFENTRHAVTHFRVLATTAHRSLVELTLETGRRHQIRVQLSEAGCPIVGDKKYGAVSNPAKRLGLHSSALRFPHPVSGKDMVFTCPLPKELARLV